MRWLLELRFTTIPGKVVSVWFLFSSFSPNRWRHVPTKLLVFRFQYNPFNSSIYLNFSAFSDILCHNHFVGGTNRYGQSWSLPESQSTSLSLTRTVICKWTKNDSMWNLEVHVNVTVHSCHNDIANSTEENPVLFANRAILFMWIRRDQVSMAKQPCGAYLCAQTRTSPRIFMWSLSQYLWQWQLSESRQSCSDQCILAVRQCSLSSDSNTVVSCIYLKLVTLSSTCA